jgi:hypothetical protein
MSQDAARFVASYSGMQIHESRSELRVVLIGKPPEGLRRRLRDAGFRSRRAGTEFHRANNTDAIFTAQAIGHEFFLTNRETT